MITRRDFARGATFSTALSYSRILGANDRIHMGYIGLGNRGDQVHDAFLEFGDQQTAAVCDLRDDYMNFAIQKSRVTPRKFQDYRKLIEDKEVDAVVVATPDHWHALMLIDACNAGKDVYVEKPLSLTVVEGRKMVETAERTKRVVQLGTNRRSWKSYQEAVEFVKSGGIGHVTVAKAYHLKNEWPNGLGHAGAERKPSEQEWDQWLGPAPKMPYDPNRAWYNFRWFYDYSGGQLTNFGVHFLDAMRWCIGKDAPRSVTAIGGRYAGIEDNREIPDTLEVLWDFGGTLMVFCQYNANAAPGNIKNSEMELRGTKGTMYIRNSGWEVVPEEIGDGYVGYEGGIGYGNPLRRQGDGARRKTLIPARTEGGTASYDTTAHARNFLDCMRTRGKCNADIVTGHLSTSATLIGNIAHKTHSMLEWDAQTEQFPNSPAANRYLQYKYRAPYKLG
jgi:predicted dehydrogenase